MSLPDALREQLQLLLENQPILNHLIHYLPGDLQGVASTPEGFLALIVTAAVGVLILIALVGSSTAKKGNTIVLAGPVNAGKSTLFYQLKDGSQHNGIVASMEQNEANCSVAGKHIRVLDIPGHHSFRHKLEASMKEAAVVVFLVDSAEITPHKVEAAEMLYEILSNTAFYKRRTPLLIACNKMDLEDEAHSVEFIRKTLEKQLDAMRKTKTASIGKDAGGQVLALGAPDKPFSLQALRSKVQLVECSAKEGQLDDVISFMASCL